MRRGVRVLLCALTLFGAPSLFAQAAPPAGPDNVPQFVRISADRSRSPAPINPLDDPVLSKRIAIRLRNVTRLVAIQEVALSSGVQFVYAGDVLPRFGPEAGEVSLQSFNITIAAALTQILRNARIDVAVGANGTVVLVRKPAPPPDTADTEVGLTAGAFELEAVRTVVVAESRKTFELQSSMGKLELGIKELSMAPPTIEGDLLRSLQTLPGVEVKNDYAAGLNVRGGESDQNLILLDGYPIYNPFHFGGLLGTFIEPMVGKVDLLTGAEPARYGERLSSVLDVNSSEATRKGVHGTVDVSLLATTVSIGSPFKDGGSWMLGARHTYWDVLANAIKPNSLPFGFSDYQAHLSRPLFGGAILSVTAYDGVDATDVSRNDGGLKASYKNRVLGATLSKLVPAEKHVLGLFTADSVSFVQRASVTTFDAHAAMVSRGFDLRSAVRDLRASGSMTAYTSALDQSVGYEVSEQRTQYSLRSPFTSLTNFLPAATIDQSLTPLSAWYDALWHGAPRLIIDAGLRLDAVGGAGWSGLSPRVSAKYFLTRDVALIASAGSYAQWLHSLAQEDAPVQPLQFWIGSGKTVPVSRAFQGSFGAEAWLAPTRQLRVEAFYKKYSNLIEIDALADPSAGDNPILNLSGRSYGADLLLRQMNNGRFGGWIAYSYVVSTRVTPAGLTFSPGQDRRHALNFVGSWRYASMQLSARFGLMSGTPYTPIVGEFTRERYDPLGNKYAPDFGDGNVQYLPGAMDSERTPLTHRLDLSITRIATGRGTRISPYLSIVNVYGSKSAAGYIYDYGRTKLVTSSDGKGGTVLTTVPDPAKISIPNLPFFPTAGVHIVF